MSSADVTPARSSLTEASIVSRITGSINHCISLIVSRESHKDLGHHLNVGILLSKGLHKLSAPRSFRKLFPELDGAQLNVSFHRAWFSIVQYIMKEDHTPFTWGHHTLSALKDCLRAHTQHNQMPDRHTSLVEKLQSLDSWDQVYTDPELVKSVFSSHTTLRSIYEDLRIIKEREHSLYARFVSYFSAAGWPEEYSIEYLPEKCFLLDWGVICESSFRSSYQNQAASYLR